MWKLVICDDEPDICQNLFVLLQRFAAESGEEFSISQYSSGEELLNHFQSDTDILFLDIKMKQLSGMDTARQLRKLGAPVMIIFITTMTQYAIEGYSVNAYGFLKKPLSYSQIQWQLDSALHYLRRSKGKSLTLSSNSKTDIINTNSIVFIEAFDHELSILMSDGRRLIHSLSLNSLEKRLGGMGFFRCHKSYLVNMKHIKQITTTELLMSQDTTIPLSRHRRKEFLTTFSSLQGGIL